MTNAARRPAPIGIVLAGGAGRRMQSPKPVLQVQGVPLVRLHVHALSGVCRVIRVVAGAHICAIRTALMGLRPAPVVVDHPRWAETDMAGSLLVGLRGLPSDYEVIVTPVDAVPAPRAVLDRLIALGAPSVPVHQMRDGHPVLIEVGPARAMLSAGGTLRDVVATSTRCAVDWPDLDRVLNTPHQWAAWLHQRSSTDDGGAR